MVLNEWNTSEWSEHDKGGSYFVWTKSDQKMTSKVLPHQVSEAIAKRISAETIPIASRLKVSQWFTAEDMAFSLST